MNKVDKIASVLRQVADELGIHPQQVSKRQLLSSGKVTDWALKTANLSLQAIKDGYFPVEKDSLIESKLVVDSGRYIKSLESKLTKVLTKDEIITQIIKNIKQPKLSLKRPTVKKTKDQVDVVAMLNDTHIGLVVDPEEVNMANSYNFKESARRHAFFVKAVGDYKRHKRDKVRKMHLILNGDLLAGLIHGTTTKTIHLMVHQVNAAVHILSHVIGHLAQQFPCLEVHCLTGNHDRAVHKEHGKRAVAEVYDSYANIVFYALSAVFRKEKDITFHVPKTPYGFIDLLNGRCMYAHGDHVFSKALGNPGRAINVKSLSEAIKDFNAGEVLKGRDPIKLLLLGHVHTFAHFITNDGVEVYIAPSLSGLDQYAHSLTINNNFTAQVVFESTPQFILGDSRLIRVGSADDDKNLDCIIPEYTLDLKFKGKT